MASTDNNTVETILNGLVHINNDRISGYQHAAKDVKDEDLRTVFSGMLNESVNFAETLGAYVKELGGEPATGGTLAGNVHQAWLDLKAAVTGNDRTAVLSSCEFGDKAAIESYDTALKTDAIREDAKLADILRRQRATLEESLRVIKNIHRRLEHSKVD